MCPVTDVMALADADSAAREAAATVAVVECPPYRRGNRPGPGIDFDDPAVPAVPHHYPAGVARQALGRSSWNARAALEDGLARLIGVRQDLGIDVDHHLVALARGARIDAVVESRLREQRQRICLLLNHRRRVAHRLLFASLPIQGLAGGGTPRESCTRLRS